MAAHVVRSLTWQLFSSRSVEHWGLFYPAWPFATSLVNVLGSFGLAFISRAWPDRTWLGVPLMLTFGTGVCGGFTTYSAFNLEVLLLFQRGDSARAVAYVAVTMLGCVAAGLFGFWCAARVAM
jgi:CrcB protein